MVPFAQNWDIGQTRMDQSRDYMKINFDYFQIQKLMLKTVRLEQVDEKNYLVWEIWKELHFLLCSEIHLATHEFTKFRNTAEPIFSLVIESISALHKQCPYSEFFWSVCSGIWTEYGYLLRKSLHLVRMRENTDQKNSKYGHFLNIARDCITSVSEEKQLLMYMITEWYAIFSQVSYIVRKGGVFFRSFSYSKGQFP